MKTLALFIEPTGTTATMKTKPNDDVVSHGVVSLSVELDSPAVAFYERNGFERVREQDGGLVMLKRL